MNKEKKNIFLIGFMGAGKSTIARAIKQKLGYPVVEMDERIVKNRECRSAKFSKHTEKHISGILRQN